MRRYASLVLISLSTAALSAPKPFGEKITLTTSVSLKEAVEKYDSFAGKDLLTTGLVAKVCEKKGCWMTIKADQADVRVTFKDYKFFVPLGSAGQTARMQGRLEKKEVSVADQKHLLEDAGADAKTIDQVKAPKMEYSFVASGVEIGS